MGEISDVFWSGAFGRPYGHQCLMNKDAAANEKTACSCRGEEGRAAGADVLRRWEGERRESVAGVEASLIVRR